jgi:hypothetical protein
MHPLDPVETVAGRLVTMRPVSRDDYPTLFRWRLPGIFFVLLGLLVLAAVACGSDGPGAPAPNTRVFKGEDGWAMAVPQAPAEANNPPTIWLKAQTLDGRTDVDIHFRSAGGSESRGSYGLSYPPGAEGEWIEAPGLPPLEAGEYRIDLVMTLAQKTLVEGTLEVK